MASAPTTPISLPSRSRLVNALLTINILAIAWAPTAVILVPPEEGFKLRSSSVVLLSNAALIAMAPSSPMLLYAILQARGRMGTVRE